MNGLAYYIFLMRCDDYILQEFYQRFYYGRRILFIVGIHELIKIKQQTLFCGNVVTVYDSLYGINAGLYYLSFLFTVISVK